MEMSYDERENGLTCGQFPVHCRPITGSLFLQHIWLHCLSSLYLIVQHLFFSAILCLGGWSVGIVCGLRLYSLLQSPLSKDSPGHM